MGRRLLLIDDDSQLATLLGSFVGRHGFAMDWADRPSRARPLLAANPDLILLDVMLPEEEGFSFCKRLGAEGVSTPVIMLTARGAEGDRIQGLRLGADDYLPKPFNPHELLARVEAVLRRVPQSPPPPAPEGEGLDPDRRVLRLGGQELPLTPSEYRLLEALTGSPGRTFTRGQLLDLLDESMDNFDRAIDVHISRLRAKIEADPKQPRHLLTVRGVGYRWQG